MQEKLKEWAAQEREKRGWSIREMGERMNSPHTTVMRVLNDNKRVGIVVCTRLAQLFNKPVDEVLEMAEWIPRRPEETRLSRELMHIFGQMTPDKQHEIIDYAKYILKR